MYEVPDIITSILPNALNSNTNLKEVLSSALKLISMGYLSDQNGETIEDPKVFFRVKLLDPEEDWKAIVKEMILIAKDSSQRQLALPEGAAPTN